MNPLKIACVLFALGLCGFPVAGGEEPGELSPPHETSAARNHLFKEYMALLEEFAMLQRYLWEHLIESNEEALVRRAMDQQMGSPPVPEGWPATIEEAHLRLTELTPRLLEAARELDKHTSLEVAERDRRAGISALEEILWEHTEKLEQADQDLHAALVELQEHPGEDTRLQAARRERNLRQKRAIHQALVNRIEEERAMDLNNRYEREALHFVKQLREEIPDPTQNDTDTVTE